MLGCRGKRVALDTIEEVGILQDYSIVNKRPMILNLNIVDNNSARHGSHMQNPESKAAIAERLDLTRRALEYDTWTAFATAIGDHVTPQKLNNYMGLRERLTLNVALLMCRRFKLTLDWLYRGDMDGLPSWLRRKIEELEKQGVEVRYRKQRR